MQRLLLEELRAWKGMPIRKPLILSGVRQCGKTYLLKEFGRSCFPTTAYFNFEGNVALAAVFEQDFDTARIIETLSILHGAKITPDTLIIFDEIQFCGQALTALKYFCEEAPAYPIVAAGSLLGLQIPGKTSFPVGKVTFLTLRPMCFQEYLLACGDGLLADFLRSAPLDRELDETVLVKLRQRYMEYACVGGMPAAVTEWLASHDMAAVEKVQSDILRSYEADFARYAPAGEIKKLNAIWAAIPGQLAKDNSRFFFSQAVQGKRARDLEDALQWLIDAGLVYRVRKIESPGIPLAAYASQSLFKVYCCDVGLLRTKAGMNAADILTDSAGYREFKGAMTENFALTELIAASGAEAYYWASEGKAEVDFVLDCNGGVPVEVKSGRPARLRSLEEYLARYHPRQALVISPVGPRAGAVAFLPLYMLGRAVELLNGQPAGPSASSAAKKGCDNLNIKVN